MQQGLRLLKKGFAAQRSEGYMTIRTELEQRAREMFIHKGGEPVMRYPHYMTLGPCDWLNEWYETPAALAIPLDAFSEKHISFTYGDLFPTMRYKDGKPYREQIYTKSEIIDMIATYGLPQQWNNDGRNGPERYIEVQIWDETTIMQYTHKQHTTTTTRNPT